MIGFSLKQFVLVSSASFAALSLALPTPLISTPRIENEKIPVPIIGLDVASDQQQVEKARGMTPTRVKVSETSGRIITPITKNQAEEGLVLALSNPAITLNTADVTEETAVYQEESSPSVALDGGQETLPSTSGALAMPEIITMREEPSSLEKKEERLQNRALSLLVEKESLHTEDTKLKLQETIQIEEPKKSTAKEPVVGVAQRIEVPSIAIDIDVKQGGYDPITQTWIVDDTAAFIADTTVPVNDTNGTTLIYGHAKWGLFGALPDLRPGAEATVYAADGSRFIYIFESVSQVTPDDLSMLTTEGEPKLVLQTCSGLFDQHRTLALFSLKEVASAAA